MVAGRFPVRPAPQNAPNTFRKPGENVSASAREQARSDDPVPDTDLVVAHASTAFPHTAFPLTACDVRQSPPGRRIVSVAVIIAVAVNAKGQREVLG